MAVAEVASRGVGRNAQAGKDLEARLRAPSGLTRKRRNRLAALPANALIE